VARGATEVPESSGVGCLPCCENKEESKVIWYEIEWTKPAPKRHGGISGLLCFAVFILVLLAVLVESRHRREHREILSEVKYIASKIENGYMLVPVDDSTSSVVYESTEADVHGKRNDDREGVVLGNGWSLTGVPNRNRSGDGNPQGEETGRKAKAR